MKKTFIFAAMAAVAAFCFTACGSDDDDYVAPKSDVVLPIPENAKNAASFEEIKNVVTEGKKLEGITFTEAGNAIVEVAGEFVAARYQFADDLYTLTGAVTGTIKDKSTKAAGGTTLSINITVTINGKTYTFSSTDAAANRVTAAEIASNTNLNNICRNWNFNGMKLALYGDVSMTKSYQTGYLKQLGTDANDNGADLSDDELDELDKTVQGIEFTMTGKLYLKYIEDGKDKTICAEWNSSNFTEFIIEDISEANKFIDKDSKINVNFDANGTCSATFYTKIKGGKNYEAYLTVYLK